MSNESWNGCWRADYEFNDKLTGGIVQKTILFDWLINPDEKLTTDEVVFSIINIHGFQKVKVLKIYYK
jgi:hypothetical protein